MLNEAAGATRRTGIRNSTFEAVFKTQEYFGAPPVPVLESSMVQCAMRSARKIFTVSVSLVAAYALAAIASPDTGRQPQIAEAATITGTVVYEGKPPRMRPLPIDADRNCADLHENAPLMTEWLLLGEGQTVANVFVQVISGLPKGKSYPVPETPAEFTQKDCRYAPHVLVLRAGQKLRILNPDKMQHNVHAMPKVNREFNKAMAKTHTEIAHVFDKPEPMFRIKCDVHSWMMAYCAVVDHPFFVVTGEDGAFAIEGLEPGEYEIEAWHEVLGTRRATVTLKEGEGPVVDFSFTRPQKK